VHGTGAGDEEHAAVHLVVVVFGGGHRDDDFVELQTFGQVGGRDDDAAGEGRTLFRNHADVRGEVFDGFVEFLCLLLCLADDAHRAVLGMEEFLDEFAYFCVFLLLVL